MNKVFLIGRLGRSPELRYTPNGVAVCGLNLATSKKYKGKEETQWHKVVVWKIAAENCCKFLDKGSQVAVEGELTYSKAERDGVVKYFTEIQAHAVEFLSKPKQSEPQQQQLPTEEDIPF